jgi:AcrR family transcriptional regulator
MGNPFQTVSAGQNQYRLAAYTRVDGLPLRRQQHCKASSRKATLAREQHGAFAVIKGIEPRLLIWFRRSNINEFIRTNYFILKGRRVVQKLNSRVAGKVDGRAALSAETQRKVIEAAIEVFGRLGFEGASTRALMARAGANLAAIPYHFGGKQGLYLAAAKVIADYARENVEPIVIRLVDADRAGPVARIDEALAEFIELLVGGPEPEEWVAFFIRCEREADDAFRMIHDALITPFKQALTATVLAATGGDAADEGLHMRIAIVIASIINLRTMKNMLLSALGWDQMSPARLDRLSREVHRIALTELLSGPTVARMQK